MNMIEPGKVFDVEVSRDGRFWLLTIPEIEAVTQARNLAEVEHMASDCIAVWLDVPLSAVKVRPRFISSEGVELDGLDVELATLAQEKAELERLAKLTAEKSRQIALRLSKGKVPMRDIGTVLHVSHQRVQQLVGAAEVIKAALAVGVRPKGEKVVVRAAAPRKTAAKKTAATTETVR